MVIFIDESGTHKQTGFANVAVVYIEIKNLEKTEKQLEKILHKLKLDVFHWADQGWKVREKFFDKITELNFTFKVAIFENPAATDLMIEIVFQHIITEKDAQRLFKRLKKDKKLTTQMLFQTEAMKKFVRKLKKV